MSSRQAAVMAAATLLLAIPALRAGEAESWQRVTELDRAPATEFKSRDEARRLTLGHLERQEAGLDRFLAQYPSSNKAVDARLRLARIYLVRGDMEGDAKLVQKAFSSLDGLATDPLLPQDRKADVAFASLSLRMQVAQRDLAAEREALVKRAEAFRREFPGDRRIASLFSRLAEVFEDRPPEQKRLLEIAAPVASDEVLKLQIADDLRRISMLGKPVELKFTSVTGQKIDAHDFRGKVVAICFFADLSAPSLIALAKVEEMSRNFPAHSLQCLGISLDSSVETTKETLQKFAIEWPVLCAGRGWETPQVRQLGINALPTVWILDRRGRLRHLNASENPSSLVKPLLRER